MTDARGWRPIETAPRDHFPRLVVAKNWPICVAFLDVCWEWWPVPATKPLDWTPTHWQPLPPPPEAARDD